MTEITLRYGCGRRFDCELPEEAVVAVHRGPEVLADVAEAARDAVQQPIDFAAFREAVVPGDRVVIALQRDVPHGPTLVRTLMDVLLSRDVDPAEVTILQPAGLTAATDDPRCGLPEAIREAVGWEVHDATDEDRRAYLASSAAGDRLYLSKTLVEADLVVPVGLVEHHSALGYSGTNSVLFPGCGSAEAIVKLRGEGHDELTPDEPRASRQLVDEVGWLLGTQFTLQGIRSRNGSLAAVLGGTSDAVMERGRTLLRDAWRLELDERPDMVVVSVDGRSGLNASCSNWEGTVEAIETARHLVERDGRIVVLSDCDETLGTAMDVIRQSRTPSEAVPPIRSMAAVDVDIALRLIRCLEWANVYLRSDLSPDLVEDLFMTPLASDAEARRVVGTARDCVFAEGAQHTYGRAG